MNGLDLIAASPVLREEILELLDRRDCAARYRAGGRFTLNADGGLSGLVPALRPRRVYLEAFARELTVDASNFEECRTALADRAPTATDAAHIRSLTWPLVASWRRMLLKNE